MFYCPGKITPNHRIWLYREYYTKYIFCEYCYNLFLADTGSRIYERISDVSHCRGLISFDEKSTIINKIRISVINYDTLERYDVCEYGDFSIKVEVPLGAKYMVGIENIEENGPKIGVYNVFINGKENLFYTNIGDSVTIKHLSYYDDLFFIKDPTKITFTIRKWIKKDSVYIEDCSFEFLIKMVSVDVPQKIDNITKSPPYCSKDNNNMVIINNYYQNPPTLKN